MSQMENFVVSARKYRPKGFEEVVGQEHITTTLENAIKTNHLAQALLFCGPRGVGKTTCARIVARMINNFEESNSLNIYELDAASNNSVDDIRNLVDQVRYAPQAGQYKVYIIDEVHMLSNAAFNAFLKTLEEPPSYAIFILATTEKHKIIPTILSRCQIFDFNRIEVSDIAKHLKKIAEQESIETEDEALHLIAQKADGALRDALSLFDLIVTFSTENKLTYQDTIKNLHILDYDYFFKVTDFLVNENFSGALLTFDEILSLGFDGHNFIAGLSEHFRDLLMCKTPETVRLLGVSENVRNKYAEQAAVCSSAFLLSALNYANKCDLGYKNAKNQRLHVELTLMKISQLNNLINTIALETEPKKKNTSLKSERLSLAGKEQSSLHPNREVRSRPELRQLKKTIDIPNLAGIAAATTPDEHKNGIQTGSKKNTRYKEFTQEELTAVWDEFANKLKEEGRDSEYTLLKQNKQINEGNIILNLHNSFQESLFTGLKAELQEFLRENLDNDKISLTPRTVKQEKSDRPYTAQEKMEYFKNKNPEFENLVKMLGLDPEF